MEPKVYVASLEALQKFTVQYQNFADGLVRALADMEGEVRRRLEEIRRAYLRQQSVVESLERALSEAEGEGERRALQGALREAREKLRRIQEAVRRVQERYEAYRKAVGAVRQLVENFTPKATLFLKKCISELEAYFALTPPSATPIVGGSSPIASAVPNAGEGAATSSGAPEGRQEEEDCRRCGGTGWISRVGSFNPERFEFRQNPDHTDPCPICGGTGKKRRKQMHLSSSKNREAVGISGTAAESGEQAQGSAGDKEKSVGAVLQARPRVEQVHVFYRHLPSGFRWVPLEEIEIDEGSLSPEKVHEKEQILSRFPDILEPLQALLYEQRINASLYFGRLDRQAGVPYAEGLQRVFDTFFGSDPIRLSQGPDGKWRVINGRHRIAAARRLGWVAVPATVEGG